MFNLRSVALLVALVLTTVVSGCKSPYYADQGAFTGGLGGAGLGAIIGSASGNAGAGALIGAGAGALTGAVVGNALDDVEAKNRAQIAAAMNRPVPVGQVSVADVVAMSRSGVQEQLIVTHIRANRMNQPIQANDLIYLQQQGISANVIQAMQESPPVAQVAAAGPPGAVVVAAPPPVVYAAPVAYYPPPYYYRPRPCGPGVSWGVSVSQ